jgi:hypothetical protein
LSPQAIALLERQQEARRGLAPLVFPGRTPKQPPGDTALVRILRRLAYAYDVHGMRSTFRDWVGQKTEFSGELAEAALAHAKGNAVEQAYRRGDALEKRRPHHGCLGELLLCAAAPSVVAHWPAASLSAPTKAGGQPAFFAAGLRPWPPSATDKNPAARFGGPKAAG